MEIRSNITEMTKKADNYGRFKKRVQSIREDLVNIMTDVDDYWTGRSGDSFKYICWYLKILLDSGYNELDNLGNEISLAKEAIDHNDINLSNQIQSKEHVKV
ncbi:MAG: hypothetical protein E6496_13275 [Lachnoanaerobaculum sp.]|jgi:hypothetical protein|nr:hypothetical protein [uncultured Lachnoanaerobaculum sp.]MDU6631333.1 hypothetical protein [Lachnoanaerobaculum sp.]